MLGAPRERIRVCEAPATSTGMLDLYPTCMAFFAGDQNNFVVGSESGNIFTDQRHSRWVGGKSLFYYTYFHQMSKQVIMIILSYS